MMLLQRVGFENSTRHLKLLDEKKKCIFKVLKTQKSNRACLGKKIVDDRCNSNGT